ncbi:hypothetical protein [Nocardia jinanensis]|uniref:DUF4190 domain-containing protein n=1 Tax=Nocardia jinanensis TaxID=382504 RepID=A0A917RAE0_9NOCA|nr:hypothetical protein [Nocardia jinanensis]GGK98368.1 hypothetical protein GCM10011588_11200 [Nocardia jinanensis]
MAYKQRWAGERWPEVPPYRDEEPPQPGRPRDDFDDRPDESHRYEARPVVNPYAIVALVAALILIFPVAIVFGLIAFGHPRGRFMACTALLLGVLEVALLAALVLLPRDSSGGVFSRVGDAVGEVTGGPQETESPETAAPETSETTRTSTPTTSPAVLEPSVPRSAVGVPPAAEADTPCPEPALLGAAADGGTLLCLTDAASVTGYQWSDPVRVAETVREEGASCTGAATARTVAGYALVCERGAWTLWTS